MNKTKCIPSHTDLDLNLDLHNGSNDSEEGAVGGARSEFPRLEGHIDVSILDQGHRTKIVCLETQRSVFCGATKESVDWSSMVSLMKWVLSFNTT